MSTPEIESLAGLALACGAADTGGPLSAAERRLAARAIPAPAGAAARTRRAIAAGEDPLGERLLGLRPAAARRASGAFYTGPAIVDTMLSWTLARAPGRIVDPGCGSGRFALAALRRKPGLEVVAIDVDPLATLLVRAGLAALKATGARVVHGDYLRVRIPRVPVRTAFVGNPPYVRHHDLRPETKAYAAALARKAGCRISGLAGLHALFYLATFAKHGVAGDVGCFVTSSEWLDLGYGRIVRDLMTGGLGGRSLVVFDAESVPFAGTMTTAAIATYRIGDSPPTMWIGRAPDAHAGVDLERVGRAVPRAQLARAARWTPLLRGVGETRERRNIGATFRVSRGQVTGANDFFVMTRDQARTRGIETFCIPLISRAKEIFASAGRLRDDRDRMVGLAIPRESDPLENPALAAYLDAGLAAGVHRGYVASRRRPWYAIAFPQPPIVATYMARRAPAFARNPDGLGLLNVAHGLYPRFPLNDAALDWVVERLNASRARFVGCGRRYHGGLEKFEPSEMEALPLPAPPGYAG